MKLWIYRPDKAYDMDDLPEDLLYDSRGVRLSTYKKLEKLKISTQTPYKKQHQIEVPNG